ncbi:MAG: beta-ketoacyl synthase, partial [Maribacter sp.]|nr:beta-ketoacyl synthase [Maribacter sp.]
MTIPISITSIASISPLGSTLDETWSAYHSNDHLMVEKLVGGSNAWLAPLSDKSMAEIEKLRNSDTNYKDLDNSVLYAIFASRMAIEKSGWSASDNFGINIGSSRGATSLFEKYHEEYLDAKKASTLSSPTTTLGNISSWVAHDLQTKGPEISHSITCSTALHALINGVAWLNSGMANKFLVGGSEAPLTPFTIAQMKAMRIYAKGDSDYPCRAMDLEKTRNTMVLGEAASVACLEVGVHKNAMAIIEGIGYATEVLEHNISISADAICFQRSMKMALGSVDPEEVDVVVMHAPGTVKGDLSEIAAIERIFTNKLPMLTTNKWKVGHTFGASGILSLELAILMLKH